jgi:hypothetical protein
MTAIYILALHVVANRSCFPKDVLDLRDPALDVVEKVSPRWRKVPFGAQFLDRLVDFGFERALRLALVATV